MCSNLDGRIRDLADLVGKLTSGQSVPAFGVGIPVVGASDGAKELVLDHPGAPIDPDVTAFAKALDDLDGKLTADKPDSGAIASGVYDVIGAWRTVSKDCGSIGGYAFSNRLG